MTLLLLHFLIIIIFTILVEVVHTNNINHELLQFILMSKQKLSTINSEYEKSGPEILMLMRFKNVDKADESDESTDDNETVIKSKYKLRKENDKIKGGNSSNVANINNSNNNNNNSSSRIDSTDKIKSLSLKSNRKRKLLHDKKEFVQKKVPKIGKFNVLNHANEVIHSNKNENSTNCNNDNGIKSIRNRRLKVQYLKIPKDDVGKYIKPKGNIQLAHIFIFIQ